jgi:hypothetical protein
MPLPEASARGQKHHEQTAASPEASYLLAKTKTLNQVDPAEAGEHRGGAESP